MKVSTLMGEIIELAHEKFEIDDEADDGDAITIMVYPFVGGWEVELVRKTKKTINKYGNTFIREGDAYEVQTFFHILPSSTLTKALQKLLEELALSKWKRSSDNRLVPIIEEE